jgi:hypothetical protein
MYFEAVLAVRAPVLNCGSILACSGKASSIETQWTQPPIRTPFQVAEVKRAQLTSILRRIGCPLRYESQLAAPQKLFPGVGVGLAWIVGRAPLQLMCTSRSTAFTHHSLALNQQGMLSVPGSQRPLRRRHMLPKATTSHHTSACSTANEWGRCHRHSRSRLRSPCYKYSIAPCFPLQLFSLFKT